MPGLNDELGTDVVAADGVHVGQLADLAVRLDEPYPRVTLLCVRTRGRRRRVLSWECVARLGPAAIELAVPAAQLVDRPLGDDELLLARHVLDSQVFDVTGRHLTRVEDVELAADGDVLRLAGVAVGGAALARRFGLGFLTRQAAPHLVPWQDIHLTTGRGYALHLRSEAGGIRRLDAVELAELVSRLPVERGAAALKAAGPRAAAEALAAAAPRFSGRLVGELEPGHAAPIVAEMPLDDAVAALRHLDRGLLEQVLVRVPTERAADLRRLLAYPPRTAAGLMTPEVRWVRAGDGVEGARRLLQERPPHVEALATVFVVDDERRPLGMLRPSAVAAGNAEPEPVTTVHASTSVEEVVDLFALTDVLALPVVDDDGRLLGAVAVDDVLEELLLERLPGRRRFRFRSLRRHAPA